MIVSDTSPIVTLAMIDRLDLLPRLYGRVVIPPAVRDEIVVAGAGQPGAVGFDALSWVEAHPVASEHLTRVLGLMLDAGEAEVIALGLESKADLLLLDERKARSVALRLGLPIAGTLDVLVAARRAGVIPAVRPMLDDLIARAHFRVGRRLYAHVLKAAGEADAKIGFSSEVSNQ